MKNKYLKSISLFIVFFILLLCLLASCKKQSTSEKTFSITDPAKTGKKIINDQVGRQVVLPNKIEKIAAMHHFDTKIIYALGQGGKMAHQGIFNKEGEALVKLDANYALLPKLQRDTHKKISAETLLTLKPDIVFVYAAFTQEDIEKYTNAGLTVIGVKGETLEDTYQAIKLFGEILDCAESAADYITYIKGMVEMVKERSKDIAEAQKPKILMTGPESIYTIATGNMTSSSMMEMAGGTNVAKEIKGKWAKVSPEQIVKWNPDYIFMGSSFGINTVQDILNNPALSTIKAVKNKKVYLFPSNIGWWDFPFPQAVLGIMWIGKIIHPDQYQDIDMTKVADEYYKKCFGYSFTEMGGLL